MTSHDKKIIRTTLIFATGYLIIQIVLLVYALLR